MPVSLKSGLRDIAVNYDLYLLDQWGVIHNGEVAHEGALEAMQNLKKLGKKVIILSNSGKRVDDSYARLENVGIARDLYDHVVTSGETVFHNFQTKQDPFYKELGETYLCFSWDDNRAIIDGVGKREVSRAEDADFILCSGTDHQDLDHYIPFLEVALERKLPLICANPDMLAVDPQGNLKMCPGRVAKTYEDMGGFVRWHGKPTAEIYNFARSLENSFTKVIGVGDSMEHDVKGAMNDKIDSLFICGGIHSKEVGDPIEAALIDKLAADFDVSPTYALSRFQW